MKLAEAVVSVLLNEGVDRIFGNPGTTELPFLDALVAAGAAGHDLPYVLGLHEGSLVATADGYARVTGRTAFVSLHIAAGLANGLIGMLNARRSRTPMVVTAGQQDRRHLLQEPMLGGDLIAIAQGASKSAVEVHQVEDVVPVLQRAFQLAATPPAGPVFVSLPMDLFESQDAGPLAAAVLTGPASLDRELASSRVAQAAQLLRTATSPAIVAGDGVGRAGAVPQLVQVAESLGAVTYHQPMHDGIDFPLSHPLHAGMLPPTNAGSHPVLAAHDVILLAGSRFWPHHYTPGVPVPAGSTVIQFDDETDQLGRPVPVTLGVGGDLRVNLAALAAALGPASGTASARAETIEEANVARRTALGEAGAAAAGRPGALSPLAAAHVIGATLPESATVVEEAITLGLPLRQSLRIDRPGHYLHTIGGGLGWGIGAAVGAGLGLRVKGDDGPVVAVVGDGSAAFGVHGLWTAANQSVPVLVVVANNAEYRTLKQTTAGTDGAAANSGTFLGMDIAAPNLDWAGLARGFGVRSVAVSSASDLGDIIRDAEKLTEPLLVDLTLSPYA